MSDETWTGEVVVGEDSGLSYRMYPQFKDRLWVNAERTVLVRLWPNDKVEVATREHPSHTWGPPVYLDEEKV